MIDTHAHLYDEAFASDREAVVQRAREAGVSRVYLPNCDASTIDALLDLADAHPDFCSPMMGLHPVYVNENFERELEVVEAWLQKRQFAAVGEIGLDYYWDKTFVAQQADAFRRQLRWAKAHRLPVVIHSRESTADCIRMVGEEQDGGLRGIFHCFGGTLQEAEQIIELGFLLGIGGVATYKNALSLHEVVEKVPLEKMVLETDAPYLAPVPYRGKRNESAYTAIIAARIAELRSVPVEEVDRISTASAERLFSPV